MTIATYIRMILLVYRVIDTRTILTLPDPRGSLLVWGLGAHISLKKVILLKSPDFAARKNFVKKWSDFPQLKHSLKPIGNRLKKLLSLSNGCWSPDWGSYLVSTICCLLEWSGEESAWLFVRLSKGLMIRVRWSIGSWNRIPNAACF